MALLQVLAVQSEGGVESHECEVGTITWRDAAPAGNCESPRWFSRYQGGDLLELQMAAVIPLIEEDGERRLNAGNPAPRLPEWPAFHFRGAGE